MSTNPECVRSANHQLEIKFSFSRSCSPFLGRWAGFDWWAKIEKKILNSNYTHTNSFFFDEKSITYLTFFFAAVFLAGAFLADFLTGEGDSTVWTAVLVFFVVFFSGVLAFAAAFLPRVVVFFAGVSSFSGLTIVTAFFVPLKSM